MNVHAVAPGDATGSVPTINSKRDPCNVKT